jgi:hypothetical protein
MTGFEKVFHLLKKEEKRTGSDYTATVSRVSNGIAYVQIAGAEITDTPVSMSIDAKPGDQVRVRVNDGKAWLTGNDTRPPDNKSAEIDAITEISKEQGQKLKELEKNVAKNMPAVGTSVADLFNFSGVQIYARNAVKYGNRVFFNIEVFILPVPTGSRFNIGTLGGAIRPTEFTSFSGVVTDVYCVPQGSAILTIDETGQMKAASSTASGGFLFFEGSYEI